jgi:O-antigen/teichoic acid export membrane protein
MSAAEVDATTCWIQMTRLTKNVIYNVVGQSLILVVSLLAVRFIFRRLGDDVFGIIFFNLTLTAVLTRVLELGVSSTIVREVSGALEQEVAYVRDLIRTASALYWAAGLSLVGVIWISAPLLATHWVNLTSIGPDTAATMLRILSVPALVALPKGLYTAMFRGRQRMGHNNAIDVGTSLAQQAGILVVLLAHGTPYIVAAWISTSAALGIVAYIVVAGRMFGWSALAPAFSTSVARRNLGFTGRMSLTSVASLINAQASQIIVSKLLPIGEFGLYGFASSTVNRATLVTGAVAQAALPALSNLHRTGSRDALLTQYRKLHDLLCYATVPLFAGVCFAALPVYRYVFTESAAWMLLLPTVLLTLGTYMNGTVNIPYMVSIATGKPDIGLRTNGWALVLVLPVTVVLIYFFGLVGAGVSWVVFHLWHYAYMVPRVCRECLGTPVGDWFRHISKPIAVTAAVYGLAWIGIVIPSGYSLSGCAFGYIAGTVGFAAGAFYLIGPDLRGTIRRLPASIKLVRPTPSR